MIQSPHPFNPAHAGDRYCADCSLHQGAILHREDELENLVPRNGPGSNVIYAGALARYKRGRIINIMPLL